MIKLEICDREVKRVRFTLKLISRYWKFRSHQTAMNYNDVLPCEMVGKYFSGSFSSYKKLMTQVISVERNGGGFLVTHTFNGRIRKTALSVFRLRFPFIS